MKQTDLCNGKAKELPPYGKLATINLSLSEVWDTMPGQSHNSYVSRGIKRPKLTCELCGRKIDASVWNNNDGDCKWVLPPHKPKKWWKKRKSQ